jgi:hypothetical protein
VKRAGLGEAIPGSSINVVPASRPLIGKLRLFQWSAISWPAIGADLYVPNRFNIEYEDGFGIALPQPEVARECDPPSHIQVDWHLGADALKERLHRMVSMQRYLRADAAFTLTVDQRCAVHAIAQDSGAKPKAAEKGK